jgi:hypothetical protein
MLVYPPIEKTNPTVDFDRYPDREVEYMGVPYPGSKSVDGVWFQRMLDTKYRRFLFQSKVREIVYEMR